MLEILNMSFVQNAVMAGLLVSITCGVIGSLIVVNNMSFIAGGIAHGAYGGIGLAFFLSLEPLLGAGFFSLLLAIIIATITLKDSGKIDSVIGAIWAFGMAIGIIFIDLTPGYNTDLMSYLFGSILAVSNHDLVFISVINVVCIALVCLFYRQFGAISFDREFAKLRGVNVNVFYYLLICMIALCIVATIKVVGLILIIALLTIPPFIAQNFAKRLGDMMVISSVLSCIFCIIGLFFSFKYNLTSGASIILVASICFFTFSLKKVKS
ncbi:MAG: metal ABC transporter permease [Campylobacter sputorum]|uniref:metal ABC transporter permease n=1 Tax=Campylobacter sputorum TaxID=206 RepID=UPI000B779A47|nr:metal ABC transporter permease [Campylobacter sputorum]ASM37817.1 metal ion ABC transporter, membrane protein [Campylobacter sputorum bv. paraureolyticus LMG 11764]MDY6119884.1 metal ABC transporter permease [Campylobacter sputorum]